jgi:hypothetical protein
MLKPCFLGSTYGQPKKPSGFGQMLYPNFLPTAKPSLSASPDLLLGNSVFGSKCKSLLTNLPQGESFCYPLHFDLEALQVDSNYWQNSQNHCPILAK